MDNYKEMVDKLLDKQKQLDELKEVQCFLDSKGVDISNNQTLLEGLIKDFESSTKDIKTLEDQKAFLDKAMKIIRVLIVICFVGMIPLMNTPLALSTVISLVSISITEGLSVVLMRLYNNMYESDISSYQEQRRSIEGMQSCIKEKKEILTSIRNKYPNLEENIKDLEQELDTLRSQIWHDDSKFEVLEETLENIRKRELK